MDFQPFVQEIGSVASLGQRRAAGANRAVGAGYRGAHADLYLTRGHSLLIDGMLFPAASLINGTTITWHEAREFDELEFFHVMFDSHDALYVEGTPCESLLTGIATAESISEHPSSYKSPPTVIPFCAPLGFNGGRSELKSRLRSALSPWFDRRHKADMIRDELDERASMLICGAGCSMRHPW